MKKASTMVSLVEGYLAARRQMDFALEIAGEQLLAFGRFADESGHRGSLTADLMIRWAQNAGQAKPLTSARRLEVLRPFAKYRSQFDSATGVSPRASQNCFTDNPLRVCSATRSRHSSALLTAPSPATPSLMRPLCGSCRAFGKRGSSDAYEETHARYAKGNANPSWFIMSASRMTYPEVA